MQTFLEELTQILLENHGTELSNICVVLPNRRAGLYLKNYIARQAKKTVWSPDIFSIEDFFIKISGYKKSEAISQVFELYEIHKTIEKKHARDFDQFLKWGQTMLTDFDEVDMHLLDAKKLYSYLTEVKALEKWNLNESPLTTGEKEYLKFYNSLFEYYTLFHARLKQRNEASQGMIYRSAAENIGQISDKFPWEIIYFAGFNALTPAEEKVTKHLKENSKAKIIRDADAYYMMDERQEAGYFLRKQFQKEGAENFGGISNHFKDSEKKIYIHGVSRKAGQALMAGKILQHWIAEAKETEMPRREKENIPKMAVALADESLLIPVLNTLPENLDTFNVTMGYPLRLTPSFTFMMLIFRLFENSARFDKLDDSENTGFYYPDIIKILQHPMMSELANWASFIHKINSSNKVFYKSNELLEIFKGDQQNNDIAQITETIFTLQRPTPDKLLDMLSRAIGVFRNHFTQEQSTKNVVNNKIQLEYLYHLSLLIQKIKALNQKYATLTQVRTLREIFILLSSGLKLPFSGEPLQGVQIMGMLETRNLDFDKVILLSANEGILPKSSTGNSFIPYDIQIENSFPTHTQKNAVFAYHFYRLLQRTKEVHIIYNTEASKTGGGDKSRFIHQILSEMPLYNSKIQIMDGIEELPTPEKFPENAIEITKDDEVYNKLLKKAENGLSPTSLNQYRRCPLQFYFRNIAGLKEAEEVEETLEHKTIGSIVHKVLEDLYLPYKNQRINAAIIDTMKPRVEKLMKSAFDEHYSLGQVKFGKNRLIFEVIKNFISTFLHVEKAFLEELHKNGGELIIRDLEQRVPDEGFSMQLNSPQNFKVNFVGSIDRVDELNGTIRIIDYKTGQIKYANELQISSWDDFLAGHKKDKAFQVMMYSWLYTRATGVSEKPLQSGIFSLRNLSNKLMKFSLKLDKSPADSNIDQEKLESFEGYLLLLLEEMFDRDLPFVQTETIETCRTCDYKSICNRS